MRKIVLAVPLLMLATPALAQTTCPTPKSVNDLSNYVRPVAGTHTIPPYPPLSVAMNEEGGTLLEALIGADGKVISDKVVKSSGSARLDDAAAEHVKGNWLWKTTFPASCNQIVVRAFINWKLEDARTVENPNDPMVPTIMAAKTDFPPGALQKLEQGYTAVAFLLSATGQISHSKVVRGSSFADLDDKAMDVVKTHHWAPATRDGQPVTTELEVLVEWSVDGSHPRAPQD